MSELTRQLLTTIGRWLGLDKGTVHSGARLGEEVAVDPLDIVELLFQLELMLGVVLPLDQAWRGMTPAQVAVLASQYHDAPTAHGELAGIQRMLEAADCQYPRGFAALLAQLPKSRLPEAVRLACQQVPVPVITGVSPILGLQLQVDDSVLTPGPETAVLARAALALLDSLAGNPCGYEVDDPRLHPRVLEIGVGSGVVSIFLARNSPRARIIATDISRPALDVARRNAVLHEVERSVRMIQHDCRRPLLRGASVDLVVSNPPFLSRQEIRDLAPLWRESTPAAAIDGGADGYELLRCVERQARHCLREAGWLVVQYSAGQAGRVADLLREQGGWGDLRSLCWRDGESCVTVALRCR